MWLAFVGGLVAGLTLGGLGLAALDGVEDRARYPGLNRVIRAITWLSAIAALAGSALLLTWVVRSILSRPNDWSGVLGVAVGVLALGAWMLVRERNYYRTYSELVRRKLGGEDVDAQFVALNPPALPPGILSESMKKRIAEVGANPTRKAR